MPNPTNVGFFLTICRTQVAKFFNPSVEATIEAIKGLVGDLNPKNTVTTDTPSDQPDSR